MGKKGKKSKKEKLTESDKKGPRITMQDLEEMSGSEGEMPPEEEWDEYAKALKEQILGGAFDHLLDREDGGGGSDCESMEEVELNSDDDEMEQQPRGNDDSEEEVDDDSKKEDLDDDDSESENDEIEAADVLEGKEASDAEDEVESEPERSESSSEDDDENEEEDQKVSDQDGQREETEVKPSIEAKNQFSSKALHLVTQELVMAKKGMPWAETFDIVPSTPLPFGPASQGGNPLDIDDDLKREVAFYDLALEAVVQGRKNCQESGIPFTRPQDFFAEMVKSDGKCSDCSYSEYQEGIYMIHSHPDSLFVSSDHMARVKDRLIFESKKMEAVAQRKSNKEHKLRAKEAQANKIAEKAKRKKDHFRAVEDWAQSAASKRGRRLADNDNDYIQAFGGAKKGPNKKRQYADKKYGFGGKRGRFKQNDPKSMNDLSAYNVRGNFAGGMKKSASGSGAKRKGKRARDASRSRRSS